MKKFITLKVGYTAGIYGCSNEYFTTVIFDGDSVHTLNFKGMYGAEDRVNEVLLQKGFHRVYVRSDFGKMTKKDVLPCFVSESEAIKIVTEYLFNTRSICCHSEVEIVGKTTKSYKCLECGKPCDTEKR